MFRIENDQLANLVFKKNVITTFYVRSNSALLSYLGVSGAVCLRDVQKTKQSVITWSIIELFVFHS